ncbi:MAG: restriction endonuclease [Planctomycetes bacterium]|nr:restriction endonuclease [Planctomycetota bacterium]
MAPLENPLLAKWLLNSYDEASEQIDALIEAGPAEYRNQSRAADLKRHLGRLLRTGEFDGRAVLRARRSAKVFFAEASAMSLAQACDPSILGRVAAWMLAPTQVAEVDPSETPESLWRSLLDPHMTEPGIAAAVAASFRESRMAIKRFDEEANELLREGKRIDLYNNGELVDHGPGDEFSYLREYDDPDAFESEVRAANRELVRRARRELRNALNRVSVHGAQVVELQSRVERAARWSERFGFVDSQYGILVPLRHRLSVAREFDRLRALAMKDKAVLQALSPREFERFCADLMRQLGFEVELTKATRDGGADLVCVRSISGIPLRMAVELKRYADRHSVDVSLVRSFVGANSEFKADKLVFVTTSSYTGPALEYARRYEPHRLSLRDYGQLQEWCGEASNQEWRLLR